MMRVLIWRMKTASLERLESLFKEYGENPEFWAKDLKKRLEKIRNSFSNDSDFRLVLKRALGSEEIQRLKQRLILKFGQLLLCWPEIVETVKVLRNQGERLARFI
jgi:translation initiation factor 2 beta subunit (eIF-2beta)/eIF-5